MSVFVQQIGLYFSDKQECICLTNRYVFVFPTEQLQMEEAKFGRQAVSSLPVALFPFSSLSGLYSVHICCIFCSYLLYFCFIFVAYLLHICFIFVACLSIICLPCQLQTLQIPFYQPVDIYFYCFFLKLRFYFYHLFLLTLRFFSMVCF